MHTSHVLSWSDFNFWWRDGEEPIQAAFEAWCPDYHVLDRVGVVSPNMEDGILHASYGLLALTTAFYDVHRSRKRDFFAYPQHFAFVGQLEAGVQSYWGTLAREAKGLWNAWSWLDVWPDSKWITVPATAGEMLREIFEFQINRLFWPRTLKPGPEEVKLPAYAMTMLATHLKAVYLYGPLEPGRDASRAQVGVGGSANVGAIVQESISRLLSTADMPPDLRHVRGDQGLQEQPSPAAQWYDPVAIDDFLADLSPCFEPS